MNQREYKILFSNSEMPGAKHHEVVRDIHAFDFRDAYEIANKLMTEDKELWLHRIVNIEEVGKSRTL